MQMQNAYAINFLKSSKLSRTITFIIIFYRQHNHLNNHELQQLVDPGFQSLDINPKDGLLEHDELSKLFDMRDTDGKIYYPYRYGRECFFLNQIQVSSKIL